MLFLAVFCWKYVWKQFFSTFRIFQAWLVSFVFLVEFWRSTWQPWKLFWSGLFGTHFVLWLSEDAKNVSNIKKLIFSVKNVDFFVKLFFQKCSCNTDATILDLPVDSESHHFPDYQYQGFPELEGTTKNCLVFSENYSKPVIQWKKAHCKVQSSWFIHYRYPGYCLRITREIDNIVRYRKAFFCQ